MATPREPSLRRDFGFRLTLGAAVLLSLALCSSRLFGITGAESALVLGLVLPAFVGPALALRVGRLRVARRVYPLTRALRDAALTAALPLFIAAAVLSLNALRVKNCAPFEGLAFMALGPLPGAWLAACVGLAAGLVTGGRRAAVALTLGVVLGTIGVSLAELYFTPAVFSFNHFAGYYPGTLYDELVGVSAALLTFRALTLIWSAAILLVLGALWDAHLLRLAPRRVLGLAAVSSPRRGFVLGAVCALVFAALGAVCGPELGHRTTSAFMAERLGHEVRGRRCSVVLPRELPARSQREIAEDCEFQVEALEARLGVRHPVPIRAFFFRSAAEKKRLMGAGSTYIAKPWRDEVYLQLGGFPHPVLAHELVHVLAANLAPGPFHIAASRGGLWPNPGLIEGFAVAVANEPRDGLTPHELSSAMLTLGLMPELESLFGLGFLAGASSRSYSAAGSFLAFVSERHGMERLKAAYATGSTDALGAPLADLEHEWHAYLKGLPLPEGTVELSRVRLERQSLFSRVCPHVIAHLELERDGGDPARALAACEQILAIDPSNAVTRAYQAELLANRGDAARALAELRTLEGPPPAPTPLLQRTREALADAAWRRGRPDEALRTYDALLAEPLADDARRPLEVKALAARAGEPTASLIRDILVGDPSAPPGAPSPLPTPAIVERAARLREARSDGLGDYLLARQLWNAEAFHLVGPALEDALRRTLPTESLRREAERLLGEARYRAGDPEGARAAFRAALATAITRHARADAARAEQWLARIDWRSRQGANPQTTEQTH